MKTLEDLRAAERKVRAARKAYEDACDERNAIVRELLADDTRPVDIANETGLSRARIAQLR